MLLLLILLLVKYALNFVDKLYCLLDILPIPSSLSSLVILNLAELRISLCLVQ